NLLPAARPRRAWCLRQHAGTDRPLCLDWAPEHRAGRAHPYADGRWPRDRPGPGGPRHSARQPAAGHLSMEDGHRDPVHDRGLAALRVDRACRELYGSFGTVRSHGHKQEGKTIMCTWQWHSIRLVVMTLALLGITTLPARGASAGDGSKVGQWKTWV